jgi:succinyl-diaminopimelate desuccinylase
MEKKLLRKLIQAETTAQKGALAAAEIISDELAPKWRKPSRRGRARSGIDCRIDSWDLNRANLTARVKSGGRKEGLLFACHLDVVAAGEVDWRYPAFGGVENKGKIYGRGSVDMKGGIAAAVTAIREIAGSGVKLEGDIIFFAAAGEETDSCGARRFINSFNNKLPEIAGVVIPEPTDFEVVTAHRGMLWLEVITKGKAAHSSVLQLGINAISSMKSFLDGLQNYKIAAESHELLGDCSMSINTISGGKEINVIPDKCCIGIDIRTLPSQNTRRIIDDLEGIIPPLGIPYGIGDTLRCEVKNQLLLHS